MPQGSNFLLLRQKKGHQRKGDPDDCPDPAMLEKKRNGPKLASLRQRAVLIAFFLRFSGTINGDPERRMFDRFAMRVTRILRSCARHTHTPVVAPPIRGELVEP